MDLGPHSLTITVGFGPSLFDERFGLADRMPAELTPFGTIPGDAVMKPAISDGDLCIQACADDPQVVFHAVRNLVRAARGTAVLKWSQFGLRPGLGHRRRADHAAEPDGLQGRHQQHPRRRHRSARPARLGRRPRATTTARPATRRPTAWMVDGSYLVARKIRMEIESWDTDPLTDQELIFARHKVSGAPVTGGEEFTPIDYAKTTDDR